MQISTSKYITLLFTFILSPIAVFSQTGANKYITRSNDTTTVVMATQGLRGEASAFLLDDKNAEDYLFKRDRYNKLKDAIQETNHISDLVQGQIESVAPTNGAFNFGEAQQNISTLRKEQEFERMMRKEAIKDNSLEEMAYLRKKYGNKPSYFINGVEVDSKTANSISDEDILTRSLKVDNTSTGNPNGEIWFVVNNKALRKIGLDEYIYGQDVATQTKASNKNAKPDIVTRGEYFEQQNNSSDIDAYPTPTISPEQKLKVDQQQREVELLKKEIDAIRIKKGLEPLYAEPEQPEPIGPIYIPEKQASQSQQIAPAPKQPQPKATTPIQSTKGDNSVISFKDSPLEKAKEEQAKEEQKEKPKRSVRKIKEREKNK